MAQADPFRTELEALDFQVLRDLVASFARTVAGRDALTRLHPWDGRTGLRRLRQMELLERWRINPSTLPVLPFDGALEELLSPGGWLQPGHWRQLREGLKALAQLLRAVAEIPWPPEVPAPAGTHLDLDRLQVTAAILPDPGPLAERLGKVFNAEGELEPGRVPGLAERFRARQNAFQAVQAKLAKLLRQFPDAFMESTLVERNGRFCLPVRLDRKGMIGGLVLDHSSSGATVFVEPFDAVPLNNDFVEADREYNLAVQAFLRRLLEELRGHREDFERWRVFQGEVDEALALLRWQSLCEGRLPGEGAARLDLMEARHPLLLDEVRASLGLEPLGHPLVPLSLSMDSKQPGLVVSGSNTGGKTVVLKTVGLLWALGASGCAIPAAEGSALPGLPTLHADIGDHQTLSGSLSTFSSHVLHLKAILEEARPGGLVLLDELGTGTDPKEGSALGIAVLQALVRRGCWVLASTHLGEVSQFALGQRRFLNASVQFDEARLAPTYHLLVGLPGQSRALTIAAKLGLPAPVLARAEEALGKREQDWREFLRRLEADRLRVQALEAELKTREAQVQKDRAILSRREEQLRVQQERIHAEAEEKVRRVLEFLDHEGKRLVKELKARQKEAEGHPDRVGTEAHERVKLLGRIAASELKPLEPRGRAEASPRELVEGSWARHRGLGMEGRVVELRGERAVLETGHGKRMEAHRAELEPLARRDLQAPRKGRVRVWAESQTVESEINLIGRASDDVETEVYRFIESALAGGQRFVRIVHGHGTGRLKAAVRAALKGHPGIATVEDAPQAQGGAGATMITLR
ncbi:MAG: Smr/MutS family protein [Acidobacteria bacterium]|nr:Smr/MutS family protein [Acidobacteriota bacterium]